MFADVRPVGPQHRSGARRVARRAATKAIMPVHLAGQPADLDPLWAPGCPSSRTPRTRSRRVPRPQDRRDRRCHVLLAIRDEERRRGKGGIIATDRDDVARAVDEFRVMRRGHGSLYDIAVPGYKANLADVNAAIALCQLDKLERHRQIRVEHVEAYDEAVAELDGIEPLVRDPRDAHALHLYVVRVDPERAGASRDEYQRALAVEQIGTSIHFLPLHRLTAYRELLPEQPALPVAERGGAKCCRCRSLPAHSDGDIADAIDALQRVHAGFTAGDA